MQAHLVRRYEAFRTLASQLRLDVSHVVEVRQVGEPAHFRNTLPFNRIFAIRSAPSGGGGGGVVRWSHADGWPELKLRAGQVVFIPQSREIDMVFIPGLHMVAVHFRIELIPGQDILEHEADCRTIPGVDRRRILGLARALEQSDRSIAGLIEARMALLGMLTPLLRRPVGQLKRHVDLAEAYRPLLQAVSPRPSARTTVPQLGELMRMPASTLSKRFRRDFGRPLKQYLTDRLVEAATRRLVLSREPIHRIAADLQFNNEQYFSRFIRKHTGRSPRSYRRHFGQ